MARSPNINNLEKDKFRDGPNDTSRVAVVSESDGVSLNVDTVSSTLIYIGEGIFGALNNEPKWKISKIDLTSGVSIRLASNDFDQIWDDRAGLTYV